MIALFPGKFQPFHKGHLETIEEILKECQSVIIAIRMFGDEPFTTEQRKYIIAKATMGMHCLIAPLISVDYWDVAYTGNNELQFWLKEKFGKPVKYVPRFGNYSASEIRLRLSKGLDITDLVCPGTEDLIKKYYA